MGKSPKTYEEISASLVEAKTARDAAKAEYHAFLKSHKLKIGQDYSNHDDAKIAKGFSKVKKAWAASREVVKELEAQAKELKPKSERVSKYEYPADVVTPEQKKKYRSKMRAAKNAADKPAKPAKEKKSKEVAAEVEAKPSKSKKDKKKSKKASKED